MASAQSYTPQTKVDWEADDSIFAFKTWRKEVERILSGPLNEGDDSIKVNTIFIWAGGNAEALVEARQAEDESAKVDTPKNLLNTLEACLTHKTYYREARDKFYLLKQIDGESTTRYYSRIMTLYKLAEFPENTDFLIVDRLVHGCTNKKCKKEMTAKGKEVKAKQCLEILREHESVKTTMRRIDDADHVNATYARARDPTKQSQRNGGARPRQAQQKQPLKSTKCMWCGSTQLHKKNECPARDSTCNFCRKQGHYEKVCRRKTKTLKTKRQYAVAYTSDDSDGYEEQEFYDMDMVSSTKKIREVLAEVTFNPSKNTLQGKVDTGAMTTCMPMSQLQSIGLEESSIKPSTACLKGITGTKMNTLGEITQKITCNKITRSHKIIITELGTELILGIDFCKKFNLVNIAECCIQRQVTVDAVHMTDEKEVNYATLEKKWKEHLPLGKKSGNALQDLKNIFPDMFDGKVGLFEGEVDLKVTPEAKPVQLPPRAVPLSVLPQLKQQLDKMEAEGIIRPCPETTDWVHNLVLANKKSGELRICLDPKNLNKYLVRSVHYTASWEDAQHSFNKGKYFSTLDAKSGYWTKQLSKESQLLTAFNTPFKKYCFIRLPFGLSVSSEIFCEQMDKALTGIPGTFPCADDVKIQGSTELRHDVHLLETIDKAKQAGIKFNPDKCHIKSPKIEYFGRIISAKGVEPCPKKVKAIKKLEPPQNKQELQSFFGTVNFMSTFIPHLSKKTHLMRSLLKKDVHFIWTSDMQKEFNDIKQSIFEKVQLTHFDPSNEVIIETDGSMKGLGAVLIQEKNPVKFISKSLTPTESDYSNIERELLAVLFACEKLHTYVYGRAVTIHTDHKPLENIFLKPISLAPARLQRMLLRLRMYNLEVKYVGAKNVLIADTLSRLIKPGKDKEIPNLDISIAQILQIRPTHLQSLQDETKVDPTLKELKEFIISGWPESINDIPEYLRPYWCFRDELTMLDGLIMKGNRVIIPSTQRDETLKRLHDGHQGLTSTLQRARRTVYWPNLQHDISDMLSQCHNCQQHAKKKPRNPERQISASRPMELLGMDLMEMKNKSTLVSIDYHSGYILIDNVQSEATEDIVTATNNNFRKFGLAEKINSDNGPCFKSHKFATFCNKFNIQHSTSSPHYHESNGRVERAIQTIKQIMKKCKDETEVTMALIAYHDTPISSDLPSPAELFFKRRINTRLGIMLNESPLNEEEKRKLFEKRQSHLKQPREQLEYKPNDPIWFTDDNSSEWKPGMIESKDNHPNSYWLINSESQRRIRRNTHDIKPRVQQMRPDNTSQHHTTTTATHEIDRPPALKVTPPTPTVAEPPEQESSKDPQPNETTPAPINQDPPRKKKPAKTLPTVKAEQAKSPVKTRSGRISKSNRDANYKYI